MLKIKKKPFFLSFFILFCFFIFFIPSCFFLGSQHLFKIYLKNTFKGPVKYETIKWEKGKFLAKNLKVSNEIYDLTIEEVSLDFIVSVKEFKIKTDVILNKPHLFLKKKIEGSDFFTNEFFNKRKIFKTKIQIEQALLYLKKEKIHFSARQEKYNAPFELVFHFEEKENHRLFIKIDKKEKKLKTTIDITNVNCEKLHGVCSFFSGYFEKHLKEIQGRVNGNLLGIFQKNIKPVIKAKLNFSDFLIKDNFSNKLIKAHSLNLLVDSIGKKNESLFVKNIGQDFKIQAEVEQGEVFSEKEKNPLLKEIFLDLYYNPDLGPKVNLQAKAHLKNKVLPLTLEIMGYFKSNLNNWIDCEIKIDQEEKEQSLFLNFLEKEKELCMLRTEMKDLSVEYLEWVKNFIGEESFLQDLEFLEGQISSQIEIDISEKTFQKVSIKKLEAKNIQSLWKKEYGLFFKDLQITADFEAGPNFFNSLVSQVVFSEASISLKNNKAVIRNIKDIKSRFISQKGIIKPSFIFADIEGLKTKVKFNGSLTDLLAHAEIKGNTNHILKHELDDHLNCILNFRKKNEGEYFSGIAQIQDAQNKEMSNLVFGINFKNLFDLDFTKNIISGWIRAEKVLLEQWQNILPFKGFEIKGRANFLSFFQNNKLTVQWQAKDFEYVNQDYAINIDKIGNFDDCFFEKKDNMFLSYDLNNQLLDIQIPQIEGNYYLKKYDLNFECKKVKVKIDQDILEFNLPEVTCKNIFLGGKVFLDFSQKEKPKLDIITDKASGSIEDLKKIAKSFGVETGYLDGVNGFFESQERGFYFSTILTKDNSQMVMGANAFFKNIQCPFTKNFSLQEGSFFLNWDKNKDSLDLNSIEGKLLVNDKVYRLACPLFSKRKEKLLYDIRLEKETLDLIRIKGEAVFQEEEFSFLLDSKNSHFLGTLLDVSSFKTDKNFHLIAVEGSFLLSLDKTIVYLNFLPLSYFNFLKDLKAEINTRIWLDENKILRFNSSFKKVFYKEHEIQKVILEGRKEKDFFIEKLQIDDLKASLSLSKKEDQIKINDLLIKKKDTSVEAQGIFNFSQNNLELYLKKIKADLFSFEDYFQKRLLKESLPMQGKIEGRGFINLSFKEKVVFETDLDLSIIKAFYKDIWIENSGPLNLYFSNENGFKVNGLDLIYSSDQIDLSLLKTEFKYVSYSFKEEKYTFNEGQIHVPKELMKIAGKKGSDSLYNFFVFSQKLFNFTKDLDFEVDVEYWPKTAVLKTYSKEACFYINGERCILKDLSFSQEKSKFSLNFEYLYKDKYHQVFNAIDFSLGVCGNLTLGKEIDPLTISWSASKEGIKIQKIQGNYFGLKAYFCLLPQKEKEKSYELVGNLKIDGLKALELFPSFFQTKMKMISLQKGYKLKGVLTLDRELPKFINFEGMILGKDFEIGGYYFKTLFSKLYIDSKQLSLKDLKISDEAGKLFVKEVELKKIEDKWHFYVPLIYASECRPSLLNSIEKSKAKEMKPLVIREFKLEDFQGFFNDSSTISGKGVLSFINSFKRGYSLFEMPAEVLGRILGLDLELLIPVCGKVFFEIKDRKCFITQADDVYSENQRSKFFIEDNQYMDFEGNLKINIKMKQYVLFKITDKFILSIKGNIKKPSFNLKKRKLFQKNS